FAVLPPALAPLTSARQYFSEATRRITHTDFVGALQLDVDCSLLCGASTVGRTTMVTRWRRPRWRNASLQRRTHEFWTTTGSCDDHPVGFARAMQEQLSGFEPVHRVMATTHWGRASTRPRTRNVV